MKEQEKMDNNRINTLDERIVGAVKRQAIEPATNEWFTRRVLNQLPTRNKQWPIVLLYVAAIAACLWAWAWLLGNLQMGLLTMRELLSFIVLVVTSGVLAWEIAKTALKQFL